MLRSYIGCGFILFVHTESDTRMFTTNFTVKYETIRNGVLYGEQSAYEKSVYTHTH